ncbi:MAG: hypothetical protein L6R28_04570 [Planctomycetes bacterium]|nr:hypothetical protein [Planctomycetota bacterium]
MSDEPQTKRPWFQLRLLTCIVLMFVAGLLIWANMVSGEMITVDGECVHNWGFPLPVYKRGLELGAGICFDPFFVFGNVIIGLLIMIGIARIMEWLLRKGNSPALNEK